MYLLHLKGSYKELTEDLSLLAKNIPNLLNLAAKTIGYENDVSDPYCLILKDKRIENATTQDILDHAANIEEHKFFSVQYSDSNVIGYTISIFHSSYFDALDPVSKKFIDICDNNEVMADSFLKGFMSSMFDDIIPTFKEENTKLQNLIDSLKSNSITPCNH